MQTQNKILDDVARVASGALGVASEMRGEIEGLLRQQLERLVNQMDLVSREEFEAVKAMAAKAREEQELLAERVAALEAKLAAAPKPAKAAPASKPAKAAPAGKPASRPRKAGKPSGSS